MNWQIIVTQFVLFLIAGMLLSLAAFAAQYRDQRSGGSLTLLLFLLGLWVVGYSRELAFQDLNIILLWVRLEYVAIVFVPVVWLYFVLKFSGHIDRLSPRHIVIFTLIPVIALLGMWTNNLHHQFYRLVAVQQFGPFTLFRPVYGPLFWLDVVYSYTALIAGMLVVLRMGLNSRGPQRKRMALIFTGALIPVLVNILTLFQVELPFHLHWTPIAFGLTGVLTFGAMRNLHLFDLVPIARDQVLGQLKAALFVLDGEKRIVDINQAACLLSGLDYDSGYGKTLPELMPDVGGWDAILSAGEDHTNETVLRIGENTLTYEIRVTPLIESGGNSLGQIVVMTDITTRKIFEHNLWTSNELLERMFSSLHHMVVFMDLEFYYIKVNQAYAEYFGYTPEEMIGLNHFQLLQDKNTRQVFKNVIDSGDAYSTVGRPLNLVDGQEPERIWEWSVQAVHEKDGRVNGLVLMMIDVTERERAIQALRESEQKYRILAENTYDWEFWLGPDGEFIYVSPACERISGYKPGEFQKNPALMETIILPEDLNIYHLHQEIAVVAREAHEAQFRIRRKDGRLIWLAHSCQPIFTADAIYLGNRGNNQDVTDKHQAAEEIARTAAIVQTTDDAIYSVDQDNMIMSWNPAAECMYGYRLDEMIGKSIEILVPNERRAELANLKNHLIGGESISRLETVQLRKDGSSIPVSLTYSPIPNKQGEFTQASVIARDISQQKQAEEAIRRRAMELEALYETSLELNDEKDLHDLLAAITQRVTNLVNAPMASIFLLNEDRTELEMVSKYNLPRGLNILRIKVGDGATGLVAASGKPVNVADFEQDENWRTRPNLFRARRFLAVPMVWNGEVIGVIDVADGERSGSFSVDHVHLVSLFANQAAIALRNAREVDRLWHQATTDPLTGLDNRRHFMELAQAACNRAFRKKLPLAILMVDIDHFKSVNDRWGHQQGDIVLVQVAETCRKSLRRGDIIGRYGGEEFIALLPNIRLAQARKIADRLVSAVNDQPFTVLDEVCRISISVGVSSLDLSQGSFPSLDEMILQSDRALYLAKQSGRNQAKAFQANLSDVSSTD